MILKEGCAVWTVGQKKAEDFKLTGNAKQRKSAPLFNYSLDSHIDKNGKLIRKLTSIITLEDGTLILTPDEYEEASTELINELMQSGCVQKFCTKKILKERKIKKRPPVTKLSNRTKNKIKQKINSWFQLKYRETNDLKNVHFGMITLTLTEVTSDKEKVYRCLNYFLTKLRTKYKRFKKYLWVAEIQDGKRNGFAHATNNIHFHIFIDMYLPIKVINTMWLECLKNEGLNADKHLNPVTIGEIKNFQILSNYLTKYITKNDTKNSKLSGALWHCSRWVSGLATGINLSWSRDNFIAETLPDFDGVIISTDVFEMIKFEPKKIHKQCMQKVYEHNNKIIYNLAKKAETKRAKCLVLKEKIKNRQKEIREKKKIKTKYLKDFFKHQKRLKMIETKRFINKIIKQSIK